MKKFLFLFILTFSISFCKEIDKDFIQDIQIDSIKSEQNYTNRKLDSLKSQHKRDIATLSAMQSIQFSDHENSIGFGVGLNNDTSAFAIGYNKKIGENTEWNIKYGNSKDSNLVSSGISIGW